MCESSYCQRGPAMAVFPFFTPARTYPVPWGWNLVAHWVLDAVTKAEMCHGAGTRSTIICTGIGHAGAQAQALTLELIRRGVDARALVFGPAGWSFTRHTIPGTSVCTGADSSRRPWAAQTQSTLVIDSSGLSTFSPLSNPCGMIPVTKKEIGDYDQVIRKYRRWLDNEIQ